MQVIRSYGPLLCPMLFTYTTILPTYPVVYLQRNFLQGPIPPIVTYIIITHEDALYMSWNQYFMMVTSFVSGCQGILDLNTWEPPLYMSEQWAWSGTYKLETSALNFIWFLMNILML